MWEVILDGFADMDDVDFAYPTTRRFDHAFEGKKALRAHDGPHKRRAAPLGRPSRVRMVDDSSAEVSIAHEPEDPRKD